MTINKIINEYDKIITEIDRIRSMIENTRSMIDEITHVPESKTTKLYYHIDNLIEFIDNSSNTTEEIQNQLNIYSEVYGDEADYNDYESEDEDSEIF